MTELLRGQYATRRTKKQKLEFYEYLNSIYPCKREKFLSSYNLFLSDPSLGEYIVTAHYDTAKKNSVNVKLYFDRPKRHNFVRFPLFLCNLLTSFASNRQNSNDNTSGILCALNVMQTANVPVILFDNEESGYSGSSALMKKRKDLRSKCFINIDSVGVGDRFVILYNQGQKQVAKQLQAHFDGEIDVVKADESRYISDSDFLENAVTVTCFKADKKGYRYIDDIHTKRDTQLSQANVKKISDMICSFLSSRGI